MRRPRLLLAILLVLALAATAAGAPGDLTGDGLDRGATLALPAIYQVRVAISASEILLESGRRLPLPDGARRTEEVGTGFGVAPGRVVTALHVVTPDETTLAVDFVLRRRAALGQRPTLEGAQDFVRDTGARVRGTVESISLRQADAGAGTRQSRTYMVDPTAYGRVEETDLALLLVSRLTSAPSLPIFDEAEPGTPVVSIGYGREGAFPDRRRRQLQPVLRRGTLGQTRYQRRQQRLMTEISAEVQSGDSGGPAVDSRGRVRGVVLIRLADGGGAIEPPSSIQNLLERNDSTPQQTRSATLFRTGMARFWSLDFGGAREAFDQTLREFADHNLAGAERERASELQAAEFVLVAPDRRRGALLALGVASGLAAAACAAALTRARRRARKILR